MKKKVVSTAFLSSLLLIAIASVKANPVMIDEIYFVGEDINATISHVGPVVRASVNGTYLFWVAGTPPTTEATIYYPVPSSASNISVKIDETTLAWNWNNTHYDTVIGDYPFINWTITPAPYSGFTISVHYEHHVPLIEGKYKFLYAFGTARLTRFKDCPANITTYISKDVAHTEDDINVYLVTLQGTNWILEPAYYAITSLDGVWKVRYTEEDTTGTKDFLITIKKNPPVGGIYIPVNKLELLAPYIGLTTLLVVAVMTVGYVKKRKRHTRIHS